MKAIQTKFVSPTAKWPARIRAIALGGFVFTHYNDQLTEQQNHLEACLELNSKLAWRVVKFHGGQLADGSYAWLPSPLECTCLIPVDES